MDISQIIGKCGNGHVVRGEVRMGRYIATTPGASVSGNCWLHCPCGRPAFVKFMKITISPDKGCNGRCMGSTGPACDCSCGGKNHGKNHAYVS